jgi:four helix bundle protein
MDNKTKINTFEDLIAWQQAHTLVLMVYKAAEEFPKKELFGLSNQITRAAVSITSNIAEGFSRAGRKEKAQFYYMSLGSLTEVQNQLIIARDLKYLNSFNEIYQQAIRVHKLISGLIKSSRNFT